MIIYSDGNSIGGSVSLIFRVKYSQVSIGIWWYSDKNYKASQWRDVEILLALKKGEW